jgi:dihydroorotase
MQTEILNMKTIIKNGRVIDPASETDGVMDVLIEGSFIAEIAENISAPDAEIVDAGGLIVAPGFVDMHTHLREPGFEHKETIETGSRSGIRGGYCALVPMANTDPVADCADVIDRVKASAKKSAWTHIYPVASVTLGQKGKDLVQIGDLKEAGVIALSDDGHPVVDGEVLSVALECANMYGLPIISHCENPTLAAGGCMHEGSVSASLGVRGIPAAAEETMVARDIDLLRRAGGRLHIAHVSCAGSVDCIRTAKREGLSITAETAPHYFTLTDKAVQKYGAHAKMNPPLRAEADVEAVKEGLSDGTIDAIATDHAPHAEAEKAAGLAEAPFGIVGLETALPLVITQLVDKGVLTLSQAIARLTIEPAKILNLAMGSLEPGARADITIFDPAAEVVIDASRFESKGRNTPFDGWSLKGQAVHVIVAGNIKLRDGMLV